MSSLGMIVCEKLQSSIEPTMFIYLKQDADILFLMSPLSFLDLPEVYGVSTGTQEYLAGRCFISVLQRTNPNETNLKWLEQLQDVQQLKVIESLILPLCTAWSFK